MSNTVTSRVILCVPASLWHARVREALSGPRRLLSNSNTHDAQAPHTGN